MKCSECAEKLKKEIAKRWCIEVNEEFNNNWKWKRCHGVICLEDGTPFLIRECTECTKNKKE